MHANTCDINHPCMHIHAASITHACIYMRHQSPMHAYTCGINHLCMHIHAASITHVSIFDSESPCTQLTYPMLTYPMLRTLPQPPRAPHTQHARSASHMPASRLGSAVCGAGPARPTRRSVFLMTRSLPRHARPGPHLDSMPWMIHALLVSSLDDTCPAGECVHMPVVD